MNILNGVKKLMLKFSLLLAYTDIYTYSKLMIILKSHKFSLQQIREAKILLRLISHSTQRKRKRFARKS